MSKKSKNKLILDQIRHKKSKECVESLLDKAGAVRIHAM